MVLFREVMQHLPHAAVKDGLTGSLLRNAASQDLSFAVDGVETVALSPSHPVGKRGGWFVIKRRHDTGILGNTSACERE